MPKLKILFLCTGNSCRSQMAEGFARHLKAGSLEPYSAGVETHPLNPRAVQVMAEVGIDISAHTSKHVSTLHHIPFDYVLTVCGHAHETCPIFPGRGVEAIPPKILHVGFDDPPILAQSAATEEEALQHYRRVRDEIRDWVQTLPDSLQALATPRHATKPSPASSSSAPATPPAARSPGAEPRLKRQFTQSAKEPPL